ncbi:MAG: ABC transporter substrate-binding protein [Rhodobacteraceae bacterium]|nr:ABC transporter substrate-binding protein [Paracoccaceae bacterium]MCY4250319.1 ABC transporter substrate-binding protein [Paracoccaceae bacterium]
MKKMVFSLFMMFCMMGTVSNAGPEDNSLNIAWSGELATLDRYYNTLREGIIVGRLVWDSLLFKNPDTLEFEPLLAKSYRFVDETTIEFDLREGITFHNGEPFDADDVVYTLNRMSNPDNAVLTQRNVNWIANAEKSGQYKVRLTMKRPTPTVLEFLAGPLLIYPNEYYEEVGPEGMGMAPIGTGPYRVTDFDPGVSITFERNENYFGDSPKGIPQIDTIRQRTIPDNNTQIAELLAGTVDWIWKVPTDQAERLAGRPGIKVLNEQTMRIGYLSFDSSNRTGNSSPVNDVRVRQAIAHAIDREAIVKALVGGSSEVVHSACHPAQFGCEQDVTIYDYDPATAKQLLSEAGYPDGFEIDFHAYRNRPYAEAIMGFLDAVGIKPNLVYLKYAALRDQVYEGQIDFNFMTWGSYSFHDVSAITSHFFKATPDDYARNETLIDNLTIGDNSVDRTEREEAYSKALKTIADNAYWVPLFSYNVNYAFHEDLNFIANPDEVPRFYKVDWK